MKAASWHRQPPLVFLIQCLKIIQIWKTVGTFLKNKINKIKEVHLVTKKEKKKPVFRRTHRVLMLTWQRFNHRGTTTSVWEGSSRCICWGERERHGSWAAVHAASPPLPASAGTRAESQLTVRPDGSGRRSHESERNTAEDDHVSRPPVEMGRPSCSSFHPSARLQKEFDEDEAHA